MKENKPDETLEERPDEALGLPSKEDRREST
jgi:hypothetical protein